MMYIFLHLFLISLTLHLTLAAGRREQLEADISGKADPMRNRIKRSLLRLALSAGKDVMIKARFVYTNGWHKVYTKPGGQKIALEDFDALNPTNVKETIRPRKGEIKKTGRIGRIKVSVDIDTKSGSSTLRIAKPTNVKEGQTNRAEPHTIDTIIVYTD